MNINYGLKLYFKKNLFNTADKMDIPGRVDQAVELVAQNPKKVFFVT